MTAVLFFRNGSVYYRNPDWSEYFRWNARRQEWYNEPDGKYPPARWARSRMEMTPSPPGHSSQSRGYKRRRKESTSRFVLDRSGSDEQGESSFGGDPHHDYGDPYEQWMDPDDSGEDLGTKHPVKWDFDTNPAVKFLRDRLHLPPLEDDGEEEGDDDEDGEGDEHEEGDEEQDNDQVQVVQDVEKDEEDAETTASESASPPASESEWLEKDDAGVDDDADYTPSQPISDDESE